MKKKDLLSISGLTPEYIEDILELGKRKLMKLQKMSP